MSKLQRYSAVTEGNGNNYCLTDDDEGAFCLAHEVEELEADNKDLRGVLRRLLSKLQHELDAIGEKT